MEMSSGRHMVSALLHSWLSLVSVCCLGGEGWWGPGQGLTGNAPMPTHSDPKDSIRING